eukprot:366506-Chlamydomonas_euryale.AAC.10
MRCPDLLRSRPQAPSLLMSAAVRRWGRRGAAMRRYGARGLADNPHQQGSRGGRRSTPLKPFETEVYRSHEKRCAGALGTCFLGGGMVAQLGLSHVSAMRPCDRGLSHVSAMRPCDRGLSHVSAKRPCDRGLSHVFAMQPCDRGLGGKEVGQEVGQEPSFPAISKHYGRQS